MVVGHLTVGTGVANATRNVMAIATVALTTMHAAGPRRLRHPHLQLLALPFLLAEDCMEIAAPRPMECTLDAAQRR